MNGSFFTFPRWAEVILGGKPAPDPKAPVVEFTPKPEPKRGRGRPPGAKNKAK